MAKNIIIEERTHYSSCELWIHTPMLPMPLFFVIGGGEWWHISR